jgi:hypothetical protein
MLKKSYEVSKLAQTGKRQGALNNDIPIYTKPTAGENQHVTLSNLLEVFKCLRFIAVCQKPSNRKRIDSESKSPEPDYKLLYVTSVVMQDARIEYAGSFLDKDTRRTEMAKLDPGAEIKEFYFDVPADCTIILMICRNLSAEF